MPKRKPTPIFIVILPLLAAIWFFVTALSGERRVRSLPSPASLILTPDAIEENYSAYEDAYDAASLLARAYRSLAGLVLIIASLPVIVVIVRKVQSREKPALN